MHNQAEDKGTCSANKNSFSLKHVRCMSSVVVFCIGDRPDDVESKPTYEPGRTLQAINTLQESDRAVLNEHDLW